MFAALALGVLLQLSATAQETNLQPTAEAIRKLQEERVNVLQQAVKLAVRQYENGALDFKTFFALQTDLLDAKLEIAETREEKIAVLIEQLKVAKGALAISKARFEAAQVSLLDVQQAKAAALRIEIKLLKLRQIDQTGKRK